MPLDQLGAQGLLFQKADDLHDNFASIHRSCRSSPGCGVRRIELFPGNVSFSLLIGRTPAERFLTGVDASPDPQTTPLIKHVAGSWNADAEESGGADRHRQHGAQSSDLEAGDPGDLGYYWQPDSTDPNARKASRSGQASAARFRIFPRVNYTTLSSTAEPIAAIRAAVRSAAKDFPEFTFGTTGRPALDADEMSSTDRDSTIAEIVAAIAVFVGLLVMLRSLWLALAAEIALAVGIGWTFGWATVSVGELNLLSLVFLIALIGIGMDYLVQVLARYRTEARRHERPKAIWLRVFRSVSAPINTACLGAAGAFLVSIFTNFRGAAELGIIAGGGLLLCLLSGYTVLPALLTIFPARLSVDVARRPTGRYLAGSQGARSFDSAGGCGSA